MAVKDRVLIKFSQNTEDTFWEYEVVVTEDSGVYLRRKDGLGGKPELVTGTFPLPKWLRSYRNIFLGARMVKETKVGGKITEKDVTVKAQIYKGNTLFLRVAMASGTGADGREYEVASNINGDSVLVRRVQPKPGPWMALGSESLIRAYAQQVENTKTDE